MGVAAKLRRKLGEDAGNPRYSLGERGLWAASCRSLTTREGGVCPTRWRSAVLGVLSVGADSQSPRRPRVECGVQASLGRRTYLASRLYVSGEFEAAFHGGVPSGTG